MKKFKVYRKVYRKSKAFAKREYVGEYEFDALDKGYYHGYVEGVKAFAKIMKRDTTIYEAKKLIEKYTTEVIGEPTILII